MLFRQVHSLSNQVQFFPFEIAAIYALRSVFHHPLWAIREGVFWQWWRKWPVMSFTGMLMSVRRRRPIRRRVVQAKYKLAGTYRREPDDVFRREYGYATFLFRLVTGRFSVPRGSDVI